MLSLWDLPSEFRHWFWPRDTDSAQIVEQHKPAHPFGLSQLQTDLIGIVLTIVGAVFASLGSIWEAYEETRHGPLSNLSNSGGGGYIQINAPLSTKNADSGTELLSLKFLFGALIWILGAGLHILALLFAATSLLGPVNSVGLVATLWLSCALLDDDLTWETWLSSGGIVVGIGICLWASVNTGSKWTNVDLMENQMDLLSSWTDPIYLGFCAGLVMFIILGAYCIHWLNRTRSEMEWRVFLLRPQYNIEKRPMLRERYERTPAARELEEIEKKIQKQSDIAGMILAVLGGTCGSQTVCQIKEVEAYWTMTEFKGYSYLVSPTALWAVTVLAVCATVQYPLISSAYALGDHATVSALYHVSWTLLSVIGGFVKFKEHRGSTGWEILWFSVGLSLTLISTFIAAKRTVGGIMNVMGTDLLRSRWYMSGPSLTPIWNKLRSGVCQVNSSGDGVVSVSDPEVDARIRQDVELPVIRINGGSGDQQKLQHDDWSDMTGGGAVVKAARVARSRSFDRTEDPEYERGGLMEGF